MYADIQSAPDRRDSLKAAVNQTAVVQRIAVLLTGLAAAVKARTSTLEDAAAEIIPLVR